MKGIKGMIEYIKEYANFIKAKKALDKLYETAKNKGDKFLKLSVNNDLENQRYACVVCHYVESTPKICYHCQK